MTEVRMKLHEGWSGDGEKEDVLPDGVMVWYGLWWQGRAVWPWWILSSPRTIGPHYTARHRKEETP